MVDISAVAGLMTSLRSIVDITKAMKDVHDANLIQTKVFELTRENAQGCALEAQAAQSELLNQLRQLEEEKAKLESWNIEIEKRRYVLTDIGHGGGMTAYASKPDMGNGEPPHFLCTNCFDEGANRFCKQKRGTLDAAKSWSATDVGRSCTSSADANPNTMRWHGSDANVAHMPLAIARPPHA